MKKATPIQALRALTAIFTQESAMDRLFLCCLLARWLDNDPVLDKEYLLYHFRKIGVELILKERDV